MAMFESHNKKESMTFSIRVDKNVSNKLTSICGQYEIKRNQLLNDIIIKFINDFEYIKNISLKEYET